MCLYVIKPYIKAVSIMNMKIILILAISISLQACVGASFITSHEGLRLNSPNNSYVKPPEFESIADGYSSSNVGDPGNPVHLDSGDIEIVSNCYKERVVSFFPAIIIPLPPLIPAFGSGRGTLDTNIELTMSGDNKSGYSIESIFSNGEYAKAIKSGNNIYKFYLNCREVSDEGKIILKSKGNSIDINLEYIKTYNFMWGWLSA
jgi:hypothetical protein